MDMRIKKEREKFEGFLEESGLKMTPARSKVFDEVMQAHGHFAPEELVKQCQDNRRRVSRASIYRCLQEMLEAGVIRETAYGEKHTHYEHMYDEEPHHHARCIKCGHLLEIPDLDEEKVYQKILEKKGFKILGHEMTFYGICHTCQEESCGQ